jgi:hypothetical protein
MPRLWLKLFEMGEGLFAKEAPRASDSNVLISILILSIVTALLSSATTLIGGGTVMSGPVAPPSDVPSPTTPSTGSLLLTSACCGILGTFLGFYIGNTLLYFGARVFGGTGDFGTQAYLQSLFIVPIGILSSVLSPLSAIPTVGNCIFGLFSLALTVYAVVLTVRALKVAHGLSREKAIGAALVPIAIVMGIACLAAAALVLLAGPVIGNTFEDIIRNI